MSVEAVTQGVSSKRVERGVRVPGWLIALGLLGIVAAATVAGVRIAEQWEMRGLVANLGDADAELRARSCYALARRDVSASQIGALCELLKKDLDADVCESAAYALQSHGHTAATPLLRGAAERLADTAALSKIIGYYARLGGDGVSARVREFSQCGRTWGEMGGGVGLLELGDVSGAAVLLRYAAHEDEYVREFAAEFLRRFSEPMTEMVGEYVDLRVEDGDGFSTEQLSLLREFWERKDRTRELRDYLNWSRRKDPTWRQVKRLIHAREKAARWLGLGE